MINHDLHGLDKKLTHQVKQYSNPVLDYYFGFFKIAGSQSATFGVLFLAVGLLLRRKRVSDAAFTAGSVSGVWVLNKLLKVLFQRNRPAKLSKPAQKEKRTSFPSGHTILACCQYLWFARLGWRYLKNPLVRLAWVLLMVYLTASIGLSRLYVRKHHPTDVIGGYLLATSWLLLFTTVENMYQRKHAQATEQ